MSSITKIKTIYDMLQRHALSMQVPEACHLHQCVEGFIDHGHQHTIHNEAWPVVGHTDRLAQMLRKAVGGLVNLHGDKTVLSVSSRSVFYVLCACKLCIFLHTIYPACIRRSPSWADGSRKT